MSLFVPSTATSMPEWIRKAAAAINNLLGRAVMKDGNAIYAAPTANVAYDQAQIQALMDAVEALSSRLE